MATERFINQASAGWTTYGTLFLRSYEQKKIDELHGTLWPDSRADRVDIPDSAPASVRANSGVIRRADFRRRSILQRPLPGVLRYVPARPRRRDRDSRDRAAGVHARAGEGLAYGERLSPAARRRGGGWDDRPATDRATDQRPGRVPD